MWQFNLKICRYILSKRRSVYIAHLGILIHSFLWFLIPQTRTKRRVSKFSLRWGFKSKSFVLRRRLVLWSDTNVSEINAISIFTAKWQAIRVSQSHQNCFSDDGQSVRLSWGRAPFGAHKEMTSVVTPLNLYAFIRHGASSLTRRRVRLVACVSLVKCYICTEYEGVSKISGLDAWSENCKWYSSATRCGFIAVLCVSIVSFATISLCVASQKECLLLLFRYHSVWKLLDTPSYQ